MAHADFSGETLQVIFEPLAEGVVTPARATAHAAGFDLRAHISGRVVKFFAGAAPREEMVRDDRVVIQPGHTALIPTGFRTEFAPPLEAQIRARSSFALRGLIVPNSPGTIDADYRGEWMVALANISPVAQTVSHGDRIAQAVFAVVQNVEWVGGVVGASARLGGFGSTGR